MSRYDYDDYYDDRYDDDDLSEDDIRETYKAIAALTVDFDGNHTYVQSVNRVFYDIFGIKEVGSLFASRNKRYDRHRVNVFRKCGTERLVDMVYDIETYKCLQALVKLHYDISRGRIDKNKADDVANVYMDTIERIKKMYGIRTRSSVSSIDNPLKMLRKMNRDYDDGIGIYDDYDDFDDRYYDDYDRGSRRRRGRRRDDDYDDSDFVTSILEGVDPDVIKRKGRSNRKSSKRSNSERGRSRDYDDDETDYDSAVVDTLGKIADKLDNMDDRLTSIERDSYYEEPIRSKPQKSNEPGVAASIDALSRSVKSIAKCQIETDQRVDDLIEALHTWVHEDDDVEEEVAESPGDDKDSGGGGDLLKSTGGIITDPKVLK